MSQTRREFLFTSASLAAGVALWRHPFSFSGAESGFVWQKLRHDAWVVTGAGGNVTVIREGSGAIVVDTKSPGFGALLRAEIETRVGPILAFIVTHHHDDHSGGAYAFSGVRSIAQRKLVPRTVENHTGALGRLRGDSAQWTSRYLEELRKDFEIPVSPDVDRGVGAYFAGMRAGSIKAWTPTQTFDSTDTLTLGRTTLELHHIGAGHTDNDLFIVDRTRAIVVAGDLLFHRHHPFIDVRAGATTAGWQRSLSAMIRDCTASTVVVSGHGPVTDRGGLEAQSRYFNEVRSLVQKARRDGTSTDDLAKIPAGAFSAFGFPELWQDNLRVVYNELARGE